MVGVAIFLMVILIMGFGFSFITDVCEDFNISSNTAIRFFCGIGLLAMIVAEQVTKSRKEPKECEVKVGETPGYDVLAISITGADTTFLYKAKDCLHKTYETHNSPKVEKYLQDSGITPYRKTN